jgi:outer membrane protein TolC
LPAGLLLAHPDIRSAEHEAAAAWAEIGAARAARWPRVNLAGALSGLWMGAMGASADFTTWSIGPALQLPLFDGGAGAAGVDAAEARYREAAARLEERVRNTVREVEDALGNLAAARSRQTSAARSLHTAATQFAVSEARLDAGAINRLEHEDALRQIASSRESEIRARSELTRAWIALVKASGNALPNE